MKRPDLPPTIAVLALSAAVPAAFWGVLHNGFVPFDDDLLIYREPALELGLTWPGLRWAATSVSFGNWCPATRLSMLATHALFGLAPWAWHATDLALHTGATILLFLALQRATGDVPRSLLVAGLFGLHPLRVESVAWASERRDVLCGLFWMAALLAHVRLVERPSWARRGALLATSALALLAKPMAVTLPLTLLLLDVWPLRRVRTDAGWRAAWASLLPCLREKVPLFAPVAVIAVATLQVQAGAGTVQSLESLPLSLRLQNAAVSAVDYAVRFFWPVDLVFFYPFVTSTLTPVRVGSAVAVIALAATATALALRRAPAVGVGLLWYAVTLAPVIGLVQIGSQASADRYTYLPGVGFAMAVAWLAPDGALRRPAARRVAFALGLAWLLVLGVLTSRQVRVWRDGETLFGHALRVDPTNPMAHYQMGRLRIAQNRPAEALAHLEPAARAMTRSSEAQANLGVALGAVGRTAEAESALGRALALEPESPGIQLALGRLRVESGRPAQAIPLLEAAIRGDPSQAVAHLYLAVARESSGDAGSALASYREALRRARAQGNEPVARAAAEGAARAGRTSAEAPPG